MLVFFLLLHVSKCANRCTYVSAPKMFWVKIGIGGERREVM